jgi:hypothetical protein
MLFPGQEKKQRTDLQKDQLGGLGVLIEGWGEKSGTGTQPKQQQQNSRTTGSVCACVKGDSNKQGGADAQQEKSGYKRVLDIAGNNEEGQQAHTTQQGDQTGVQRGCCGFW